MGVDLGGTKILGGVVDPKGKILSASKKKTRPDKGTDQVLERIVEVARDASAAAGIDIGDLGGLGIGAPGQIDLSTGTIVYAPNLGWKNIPLRDHLSDVLGIPVALDNDVNAVAMAEHTWGVAKGVDCFVAISVGTGIGAGIVIGGRLWHGFNGMAGEIGHTVIDQDGPKWPASNRGCLEAMASRTAIAQRLERAMAKGAKTLMQEIAGPTAADVRSKALQQCLREGDKLVTEVMDDAARLLGLAVGNVINFLGPEMIVLGGGVMEACGEDMIKTITKVARKTAIATSAEGVQIVLSELRDDAGLLGAASLAVG